MLSVNLIYLGNEKEKYYNEAADEYIKRLRAFCTFNSKNLKDERLSLSPFESEFPQLSKRKVLAYLKQSLQKATKSQCASKESRSPQKNSQIFCRSFLQKAFRQLHL